MKKTHDYDNTFQTIKIKHKRLLIAVINECFHKNYPLDASIELLPTRSQLTPENDDGKINIEDRESDVLLRINEDYYLMEVQAYDDENMAIRIAEYTFLAARDTACGNQGKVVMNTPHFTVIYLKPTANTPEYTEITYAFPNGETVSCREKNVLLDNLSREEIIEKKLYAFIPFFIIRYEKELSNEKGYQKAMDDLVYFREKMLELHQKNELSGKELTDLGSFVNNIVTHITDGNSIEKEVTGIMGGHVYETESERLQRVVREELEPIIEQQAKELAEKNEALTKSQERIAELEQLLAAK